MKHTKKIKINKNYVIGITAAILIVVFSIIGVHLLSTTHAVAGDAQLLFRQQVAVIPSAII